LLQDGSKNQVIGKELVEMPEWIKKKRKQAKVQVQTETVTVDKADTNKKVKAGKKGKSKQ
jgi:hypothetical protein